MKNEEYLGMVGALVGDKPLVKSLSKALGEEKIVVEAKKDYFLLERKIEELDPAIKKGLKSKEFLEQKRFLKRKFRFERKRSEESLLNKVLHLAGNLREANVKKELGEVVDEGFFAGEIKRSYKLKDGPKVEAKLPYLGNYCGDCRSYEIRSCHDHGKKSGEEALKYWVKPFEAHPILSALGLEGCYSLRNVYYNNGELNEQVADPYVSYKHNRLLCFLESAREMEEQVKKEKGEEKGKAVERAYKRIFGLGKLGLEEAYGLVSEIGNKNKGYAHYILSNKPSVLHGFEVLKDHDGYRNAFDSEKGKCNEYGRIFCIFQSKEKIKKELSNYLEKSELAAEELRAGMVEEEQKRWPKLSGWIQSWFG